MDISFTICTSRGCSFFYFLVAASLVVLVLGIERIVLALDTGRPWRGGGMIALEIPLCRTTGVFSRAWTVTVGFVSSAVGSSAVMLPATVWYR